MTESGRLFILDIIVLKYLLGVPSDAQLGNYSAKPARLCTNKKSYDKKLFSSVSVVMDMRRNNSHLAQYCDRTLKYIFY